jgi:hypothetical protein
MPGSFHVIGYLKQYLDSFFVYDGGLVTHKIRSMVFGFDCFICPRIKIEFYSQILVMIHNSYRK